MEVIILSVLFIFLILNTKAMGNKFDEVLEKLDVLKAKVIADEAAESEAIHIIKFGGRTTEKRCITFHCSYAGRHI